MSDPAFFEDLQPGDAEKLLPSWTATAAEAARTRDRLLALVGQPEHSVTDRGFRHMVVLDGADGYGGHVRVYESSGAAAAIWLSVTSQDGQEVTVHLNASEAATLALQIEWLLHNHYQGDAWPKEEET